MITYLIHKCHFLLVSAFFSKELIQKSSDTIYHEKIRSLGKLASPITEKLLENLRGKTGTGGELEGYIGPCECLKTI